MTIGLKYLFTFNNIRNTKQNLNYKNKTKSWHINKL